MGEYIATDADLQDFKKLKAKLAKIEEEKKKKKSKKRTIKK